MVFRLHRESERKDFEKLKVLKSYYSGSERAEKLRELLFFEVSEMKQ